MADTKTDKEPSIEEILESIRQIISEDEPAPAKPAEAAPQPAAAAPAPTPPPAPIPAQVPEEPVLVLKDRVMPVRPEPEPVREPEPVQDAGAHLLSDDAANASASAMARLLAGNVAVERELPGRVGQVTLEDMANELMRPLIKTWLDQNLPRIIEKMVQKEIERVSRKAMSQ